MNVILVEEFLTPELDIGNISAVNHFGEESSIIRDIGFISKDSDITFISTLP